jgi:hypothetical protein
MINKLKLFQNGKRVSWRGGRVRRRRRQHRATVQDMDRLRLRQRRRRKRQIRRQVKRR